MDEHFFTITLQVQDRTYRLRIKRENEQQYRDAAKAIDKKVKQYKNRFVKNNSEELPEKDYYAMVSIQAVAENMEKEIEDKKLDEKLASLVDELDVYLRKIMM